MAGCLRSAVPLALRSNLIETIGGLRGLVEKLPGLHITCSFSVVNGICGIVNFFDKSGKSPTGATLRRFVNLLIANPGYDDRYNPEHPHRR
jgi:hypothetical protein